MANFEIFSNSSQVYVTIFAFICMAFATFFSRDKKIFTPIVLLTLAIMFDFFAAWREAEVVQAYSMGYGFRGKIISELFLTVISMSLMSLSASYFLSPSLKDFSSIPARTKQALSNASGRSVEVRMQTAGKGLPMLVKNELSSGSVPLSETTAKAFICRQL